MRTLAHTAGLILAAIFAVTACGHAHNGPPAGSHSSAAARVSSALAGPTTSADLTQAKADIKRCITGTPLQQAHTVHVAFAESASGANGAEVTATRAKVFGCLGVPAGQRTAFRNAALAAAEAPGAKVYTQAGAKAYAEVTLPRLLAEYQARP